MNIRSYLQIHHLSFNAPLGASLLLDNISFRVNQGEKIAVVGANGSGKTTLFRLLNRLCDPSSGKIYLADQDYQEIHPLELRKKVVLVGADVRLLGMTVKEAIVYPLKLRKMPLKQIDDRLNYWLEQLHIPRAWLHRQELELSAGQKQIVSLARALIIEPEILLLDEPTSTLDAGKAHNLLEILASLSSHQVTILMTNHQLDLMAEFADRMLYLQLGKLIADLSIDQVDWHSLKKSLITMEKTIENTELSDQELPDLTNIDDF